MACTANRATDSYGGMNMKYAVAASTTIYAGSLVGINSDGYAVPCSALAGNKGCPGVAIEKVVNGTTAGEKSVTVQKGVFQFAALSGGASQAWVGETAWAADDCTIGITDTGNLCACGKVVKYVSANSVWVEVFGFDVTY